MAEGQAVTPLRSKEKLSRSLFATTYLGSNLPARGSLVSFLVQTGSNFFLFFSFLFFFLQHSCHIACLLSILDCRIVALVMHLHTGLLASGSLVAMLDGPFPERAQQALPWVRPHPHLSPPPQCDRALQNKHMVGRLDNPFAHLAGPMHACGLLAPMKFSLRPKASPSWPVLSFFGHIFPSRGKL